MNGTEERYKFVTSQCIYCNEKIIQSFTLFLKMLTAIAGGVIWLRLQPGWEAVWPQVRGIATGAFIALGVSVILMIWRYARSWWGYRVAEAELTKGAAPKPSFPGSCFVEIAYVLVVAAATSFGAYALLTIQ